MKIYYDTEFIENGSTIELISIGLVREDGAEYYAVRSEIGALGGYSGNSDLYHRICNHHWLMTNVVPHLPVRGKVSTGQYASFTLDTSSTLVRPKFVIANEVRDFILAAPDPSLWAWYAAYDHVALCQLWGPMISLPEGVPMWTNDLKQEVVRLGNPELPPMPGVAEHNALSDAREVAWRHQWLARRTDVPQ